MSRAQCPLRCGWLAVVLPIVSVRELLFCAARHFSWGVQCLTRCFSIPKSVGPSHHGLASSCPPPNPVGLNQGSRATCLPQGAAIPSLFPARTAVYAQVERASGWLRGLRLSQDGGWSIGEKARGERGSNGTEDFRPHGVGCLPLAVTLLFSCTAAGVRAQLALYTQSCLATLTWCEAGHCPADPSRCRGLGVRGARHASAAFGGGTVALAYQTGPIADLPPSSTSLRWPVTPTGSGTVPCTAATVCRSTFQAPITSTAVPTPAMRPSRLDSPRLRHSCGNL